MAYFPFFMDVTNQTCLIIGGGQAAYQKAEIMLLYDVEIHIISSKIDIETMELWKQNKQKIAIEERDYEEEDLKNADFVFAALEDPIRNHQIAMYCKDRKIPVNVLDVKADCSFIMPALLHSKEFDIAISSGGKSPAAVRHLKELIVGQIPTGYDQLIEDLALCRNYVMEQISDAKDRRQVFDWLLILGLNNQCKLSENIVKYVVSQFQESE